MTLDDYATRWEGSALRHIPHGSPIGVLDFRFAGRSDGNRWNYEGDRTVYLASDFGVVVTEFGRHVDRDYDPSVRLDAQERDVFRLQLRFDAVLDLRRADVGSALSLGNTPHCFLDKDVARATAVFLRRNTKAQALQVPSVGFLDDPENRWCLVLFLEKLPADPSHFITSTLLGTIKI